MRDPGNRYAPMNPEGPVTRDDPVTLADYPDKYFDPAIAPITFGTWLTKDCKDFYPVVRDQSEASQGDCCAHCCLCLAIELRNKYLWLWEDGNKLKSHRQSKINVEYLIKIRPPPTHPREILDKVIEEGGSIPMGKGVIKRWQSLSVSAAMNVYILVTWVVMNRR